MNDSLKQCAQTIFSAGLKAVDPRAAVRRFLRREGNRFWIGETELDLTGIDRIVVLAAGKAAGPMAAQVESILGDALTDGLVITKDGHGVPLDRLTLIEASHPLPDARGEAAARQAIRLLESLTAKDLCLCLLSGGGSALLPCPVAGVSLGEKIAFTDQLLACGADIVEINTLRKHLSRLKGGRLAQLAAPACVFSLILSDVVGDPLEVIASAPTVADPTTFADAMAIVDAYGLRDTAPSSVLDYLQRGRDGAVAETPKTLEGVTNLLIGTNRIAVDAAADCARQLGYTPMVLSTTITGETRDVAAMHVEILREIQTSGQPLQAPACLLSGGETTVTLSGEGKGGRNQEFALAAAIAMAGMDKAVVLCGGTDGTDGPTDAAGAIADGQTLDRARAIGLDALHHLTAHDAYPFFAALGDLLITGPTGTNVMDLRILLIDAP